jgi:hypothetical protein
MCMADDADWYWKVFNSATRRAAKEHRCTECQRTIAKGETYRWASGLNPETESWDTFHTCAHCDAATAWLVKACNGYIYCMVLEDLEEHWRESELYRSTKLQQLIEGMKSRWHDGADPVPDVDAIRASVPVAA